MQNLLLKWLVLTLAVVVAAYVVSLFGLQFKVNVATGQDLVQLFMGSAALAFVNATLGRVIKFLATPVNCLTLGIASLVINALLLWWVGSMGLGFEIGGFWPALLGSILISIANGILGGIILPDKEKRDS